MRHKKGNKFGADKTTVDNIVFDSAAEAKRYCEVKLLLRAGEITDLELQPRFGLEIDGDPIRMTSPSGKGKKPSNRQLTYVADFRYVGKDGEHIEDVKGKDTRLSQWKRSLVEHIFGVKIELIWSAKSFKT